MKVFIAKRVIESFGEANEDKVYSTLQAAIFNLANARGYHNYAIKRTTTQMTAYGTAAKEKIKEYELTEIMLYCYSSDASSSKDVYVIIEHEVITGDDAYTSPPSA